MCTAIECDCVHAHVEWVRVLNFCERPFSIEGMTAAFSA